MNSQRVFNITLGYTLKNQLHNHTHTHTHTHKSSEKSLQPYLKITNGSFSYNMHPAYPNPAPFGHASAVCSSRDRRREHTPTHTVNTPLYLSKGETSLCSSKTVFALPPPPATLSSLLKSWYQTNGGGMQRGAVGTRSSTENQY